MAMEEVPALANEMAVALPMPLDAPVTKTLRLVAVPLSGLMKGYVSSCVLETMVDPYGSSEFAGRAMLTVARSRVFLRLWNVQTVSFQCLQNVCLEVRTSSAVQIHRSRTSGKQHRGNA